MNINIYPFANCASVCLDPDSWIFTPSIKFRLSPVGVFVTFDQSFFIFQSSLGFLVKTLSYPWQHPNFYDPVDQQELK